MLSKLVEEFLKDYLKREPYATKEELINVLSNVELLIRQNKDKSIEEIVDLIIQDNILEFELIRKKYGVPGYTASIKLDSVHVKIYGGNIDSLGNEMPDNALYDIASMTKFYTQIVAYNLIREGVFCRTDKISNLDSRFINLGNLTIDDVLTFGVKFKTDELIRNKKTIDEAKDTLFHAKVIEIGKWNYNDIGLMILKEVMEKLTGLTYVSLVNKYIVEPLHLNDTHIIVPLHKIHLLTGSPNTKQGHINDMSANALGGYSGHAGIFSSSDDLVKLMEGVRRNDIVPDIKDAYTKGKYRDSIAIMGNVYINNPQGTEVSYINTFEPNDSFAIAGSTRTFAIGTSDSTYNLLFNPSSMDVREAKERITKINEERIKNGKDAINPVCEFDYNHNKEIKKYTLIDSRQIFPLDDAVESLSNVACTTLKLRFLDFLVKKQEKNIKEIEVIRQNK